MMVREVIVMVVWEGGATGWQKEEGWTPRK